MIGDVSFLLLVVTEAELNKVHDVFRPDDPRELPSGGRYWPARVPYMDGSFEHSVLIHRIAGRSNPASASSAVVAIRELTADFVITLGTAGGVKTRGVRKGDVVFSEAYHYVPFGKRAPGGKFTPRTLNHANPSARLLKAARAMNLRSEGWYRGTRRRPGGGQVSPTSLGGDIASVDGVSDDPDDDNMTRVREDLGLDKVLAVEMESAGIARAIYEASPSVELISVRGISDFIDSPDNSRTRRRWSPYAIEAAAHFAKGLIASTANSPDGTPYLNRDQVASVRPKPVLKVQSHVRGWNVRDYRERLRAYAARLCRGTEYPRSYRSGGHGQVNTLRECVLSHPRTLIWGRAGLGKTHELGRLVLSATEADDISVVLLDMKHLTEDVERRLEAIGDADSLTQKLDVLLRISPVDVLPGQLQRGGGPLLVVLDGVNETYGNRLIKKIIPIIDDWARSETPRVRAVVSDRIPHRSNYDRWEKVELLELADSVVADVLVENFGRGAVENMSLEARKLLQTPYYLEHVCSQGSLGSLSASGLHEKYFTEQVGLGQSELDYIAQWAFETYHGRGAHGMIPTEDKDLPVFQTMFEAGTLIDDEKSDLARLSHQLMHDYLAARHLSSVPERWGPAAFDAVTLKSNSFEALVFAAQLVEDTEGGDELLKEVYDWNWVAATRCVSNSSGQGSQALKFAVLSVLAQKRFDPVQPTAVRAESLLEEAEHRVAAELAATTSLSELRSIVAHQKEDLSPWFHQWKTVFLLDDVEIDRRLLTTLHDDDPLLGWTLANSLRFQRTAEVDFSFLRGLYAGTSPDRKSARWRIVHLLGGADDTESVELLWDTLDSDDYYWVRYGATRSLVEIAARCGGPIAHAVVEGLIARSPSLPDSIRTEAYRASKHLEADPAWPDLADRLVREFRRDAGPRRRQKWDRRPERVRQFFNRVRGSTTNG